MLQIIGIILLILIAVGTALAAYVKGRPAVPTDYQRKALTGGRIEKKFMANGPFDVAVQQETVLQAFQKYIIHYPSVLAASDQKYPVIVLCNGSGTPLSKYPAVAAHYASWGFIIIGTEEMNAWNGFGAEMCLRHLKRLNDNEAVGDAKSVFYQKVDFDKVGIVGHSQGGVGVINAITAQPHGHVYQAAVSLSPTNQELARRLEWDYDAARINVPTLLLAGGGGGDDWVVTGEQLAEIYDEIGSAKLMARRKNTAHNDMLYSADGYVVAWFMWHLQGDEEARNAFAGEHPELMANELYQDPRRDIGVP